MCKQANVTVGLCYNLQLAHTMHSTHRRTSMDTVPLGVCLHGGDGNEYARDIDVHNSILPTKATMGRIVPQVPLAIICCTSLCHVYLRCRLKPLDNECDPMTPLVMIFPHVKIMYYYCLIHLEKLSWKYATIFIYSNPWYVTEAHT